MRNPIWLALAGLGLAACGSTGSGSLLDAGEATDAGSCAVGHRLDTCGHCRPDHFADRVVSFTAGPNAGFGQDRFPCIVLGPPEGGGQQAGSLDVLSLGKEGEIVLAFDDVEIVDGVGPDLLVFENPFQGYVETGYVAASEDGLTWKEWPCKPTDADGGYPGCAGVNPVNSNSKNGIDPTDVSKAGGDAFDLADLGLARARFIRIRDSGLNPYAGISGGFDLDAVAAVNSAPRQ
jgi:hypothetical protein